MLGYATKPTLYIVQELLDGGSLDKQLYVEHWRPDEQQLLKGALDVASGMEYLHTHFTKAKDGRESKRSMRPVIHRDLKSPNILLDKAPPVSRASGWWEVQFKVADFGLSRDKELISGGTHDKTGGMTGCGSVLWMAPEILLGEKYNQSVDVFSCVASFQAFCFLRSLRHVLRTGTRCAWWRSWIVSCPGRGWRRGAR